MYFPYLRGRQFELIALRELIENNLIGNHIYPVIEPVKLSSTLTKTLNVFKENNRNLAIIMNPCVGNLDFKKLNDSEDKVFKTMNEIINISNIKKLFLTVGKSFFTFASSSDIIILYVFFLYLNASLISTGITIFLYIEYFNISR